MTGSTSDGFTGCEPTVAARRTAMLMTNDPRRRSTLISCYYDYQQ